MHKARVAMGITLTEWEKLPGTPEWVTEDGPQISKSHVIAWNRLNILIDNVFTEASKK